MLINQTIRLITILILLLFLTGCDFITSLTGSHTLSGNDENIEIAQLSIGVSPHIAWMPWYLANEEDIFREQSEKYKVDVQFISDHYRDTIDKFVMGEIDAIAITNIDAIAQLVRRDIEADVILITSYSNGDKAILLPTNADTNVRSIRGKMFALVENSARHYLLDRYLIRNQIPFEDISILNTSEIEIPKVFSNKEVYGVVTSNPNVHKMVTEANAKVLFDSREVTKEIFDLLVVRRDILRENPNFAQVLLATWFAIMERLQGNKKGPTLDALARLAGLTREQYDEQLATVPLNDTPTKALSAIRDRRIRKTMRHLRYFIERHELMGTEVFTEWVSYPGRMKALLHFNGEPLQKFVYKTI